MHFIMFPPELQLHPLHGGAVCAAADYFSFFNCFMNCQIAKLRKSVTGWNLTAVEVSYNDYVKYSVSPAVRCTLFSAVVKQLQFPATLSSLCH